RRRREVEMERKGELGGGLVGGGEEARGRRRKCREKEKRRRRKGSVGEGERRNGSDVAS
ncbi:hypothetical protein Droror1_Dr00020532, partial [Drosera rotundifolia]